MWAISQLLLTRFWWNFKGRLLGTSRTDSNCHGDICPRNICTFDIYLYQEYLSCYWPDFDETLNIVSWEHLEQIPTVTVTFGQATFVLVTFVQKRNISTVVEPASRPCLDLAFTFSLTRVSNNWDIPDMINVTRTNVNLIVINLSQSFI